MYKLWHFSQAMTLTGPYKMTVEDEAGNVQTFEGSTRLAAFSKALNEVCAREKHQFVGEASIGTFPVVITEPIVQLAPDSRKEPFRR